jgi:hypothetical protein
MVPGEYLIVMTRPRVPLPLNPTPEQKAAVRPFMTTSIPITDGTCFTTFDDARDAMRTAFPVRCLIDIVTSDKAEGRLLKALQVLNQGKRINTRALQYKDEPAFIQS